MNASAVFSALLPVVVLIAMGFVAGKLRWVRGESLRDLSNLTFWLLAPPLLFHSMSRVQLAQLSLAPVAAYFAGAAVIFIGMLCWRGFDRRSIVLALAATYGNTVMIGIALVSLAYGPEGMVVLLTVISLHSLLLLTTSTVMLELAVAHENAQSAARDPTAPPRPRGHLWRTLGSALRNALIHPVQTPILLGLAFAQTGWVLPKDIDVSLGLIGQAYSPVALMLVGITLAQAPVGDFLRGALALTTAKNLLHPLLTAGFGWAMGLHGLPLTVMVVTAAMPIGANVFLFAQRYSTSEGLVTASVAVSTALGLVTLTLVMTLAGLL